eukprot:TRINITY_DN20390_c0_g1_i1.p1 TRINITY_DN20390_c0_g1~~TRINITY_DN20390_c0_g1_i1.p1  ORF type:complete len:832 (-),score=168.50 TRINITY_DN20390_c0_g1_i1:64-2559(-)
MTDEPDAEPSRDSHSAASISTDVDKGGRIRRGASPQMDQAAALHTRLSPPPGEGSRLTTPGGCTSDGKTPEVRTPTPTKPVRQRQSSICMATATLGTDLPDAAGMQTSRKSRLMRGSVAVGGDSGLHSARAGHRPSVAVIELEGFVNKPLPGSSGGSSPARKQQRSARKDREGKQPPPQLDDDAHAQLLRRLAKSDELIQQLKHIVKAQHSKIEEMREEAQQSELFKSPFSTTFSMMQSINDDQESVQHLHENQRLQKELGRLKATLARLKTENDTLRKTNSRYKSMLYQVGASGIDVVQSRSGTAEEVSKAATTELPSLALAPGGRRSPDMPSQRKLAASPRNKLDVTFSTERNSSAEEADIPLSHRQESMKARGRSRTTGSIGSRRSGSKASSESDWESRPRLSSSGGEMRQQEFKTRSKSMASQDDSLGRKLPMFSTMSLLHNVMPMFWRKRLDTPQDVLRALLEVTTRILADKPGIVVTLYMLDPWLRKDVDVQKDGGHSSALFYLGQGKVELQVLPQEGVRPEPPRFEDLIKLPMRTRKVMAAQLQLPTKHRNVAVVQALQPLLDARQDLDSARGLGSKEAAGFTDSQMMCLQLVCGVAGGLLEQLETLMAKELELSRHSECVDVAISVNKARSLPDFEQLVKHHLGPFFKVNTVRVLFYDQGTEKLLVSSAQMKQTRRKECMSINPDKGIVGLCVRRSMVVHVPNISQNPYVDVVADGLERNGRQVGAQAAMLCGPMVVDYDEGSRLIGVVQLLERTKVKRSKGEAAESNKEKNEFTNEDEMIFKQLLRVLAHCALRTLQVQELATQMNDGGMQTSGLQRMMMAG